MIVSDEEFRLICLKQMKEEICGRQGIGLLEAVKKKN